MHCNADVPELSHQTRSDDIVNCNLLVRRVSFFFDGRSHGLLSRETDEVEANSIGRGAGIASPLSIAERQRYTPQANKT